MQEIIHDGVRILCSVLAPHSIHFPTGGELGQVMVDFERLTAKPGKAGLPVCAGAMDGTFLKILKPSLWGNSYYCYKSFLAIVILAVVDARCIFTYIDAGRAGSMGMRILTY